MTNPNPSRYVTNTPPSPVDQRDYRFAPKIWPASAFAQYLDLLPNVEEVEDQLNIGSCVANGVASQCEWLGNLRGKHLDLSRLFLYTATLAYENRLGQEGLYTRDAYKIAYAYGICSEATYPYDTSKSAVAPPESAYLEANQSKVLRYEAVVAPSSYNALEPQERIDFIKAALNEGLPVGVAFQVTSSIYGMTGPWVAQNYQLAGPNNPVVGGHYMVIIGYDDRVGKFLVQNSWGPQWGDGGFGGFPYGIVNEMFFEAWIVRNFNGDTVPEAPGIKFEGQNRFRIDARIVPKPEEVGTTKKVWIGAKLPDGRIFLRTDLVNDIWVEQTGDAWPETGYVTLAQDTPIEVVRWKNLTGLEGTKVYMAYGDSILDWTGPTLLCTIPYYA